MQEFNEELERRLQMIEQPDYEDPARNDLPYVDLVLLTVVIFFTVVLMYWWGY